MTTNNTLTRKEQEILEQLALVRKEQELLATLSEIRSKLDGDIVNGANEKLAQKSQPTKTANGFPKGNATWEKYVLIILASLGGKRKAQEIKRYAREANPTIDNLTIQNAITNKLSKLYKDGDVSAIESENKKEGYLYFLTEEQKEKAKI